MPNQPTSGTRMSPRPSLFRALTLGVAFAAALLAAGCGERVTGPKALPEPGGARLNVHASVAGQNITAMTVEVTGPGIPNVLVFQLTVANGVASGSIQVPAGQQRTIVVHAFDQGAETHRGQITMDVIEGSNPTINVVLTPLVGSLPITVSFGSTLVVVKPLTSAKPVGDTIHMSSEIHDQNGNITSGAGQVIWATMNPLKATVTQTGVVTLLDTGSVQIVATLAGVAGSGTVTGLAQQAGNILYLVTWTGAVSTNWTDANNWNPSRVPTLADSVVIPAGTTRSPLVNNQCATNTNCAVRDLTVKPGATLGTQFGHDLDVYGAADGQGTVNTQLIFRGNTAKIRGTFAGRVYMWGTVTVTGPTTINADLRLQTSNSISGNLVLNGNYVTTKYIEFTGGSVLTMTNPKDTLDVGGDFYMIAGNSAGKITAGAVLFRGVNFNGGTYLATGTNRVEMLGTQAAGQYLHGFNYFSTADDGLQNLIVANTGGLHLCAHAQVADSFLVKTAVQVVNNDNQCGNWYLRVSGDLRTVPQSLVKLWAVELFGPHGTSHVDGTWTTLHTDFYTANAPVKPSLAYHNLRFYQPNKLLGPVAATGQVYASGTGTSLDVNGQTLTVGANVTTSNVYTLHVENGASLTMDDAADRIDVLGGDINFNGAASPATHALKITAGVINHAGFDFHGGGFGATGTHKVVLNRSTGVQRLHSMNFTNTAGQTLANLEIAGGAQVDLCSYVHVLGTFEITNPAAVFTNQNNACGNYYMRVSGDLRTAAGSTFNPHLVQLMNPQGTSNVLGTFTPEYTDFHAVQAPVKPTLGYRNLRFYAANTLLGNTTANGHLYVSGTGVFLDLNGKTMDVAGSSASNNYAHFDNGAWPVVQKASDVLRVAGDLNVNSVGNITGKVTDGLIQIGGDLHASNFTASGASTIRFAQRASGARPRIWNMDYISRPWQQFGNLEVAKDTVEVCSHIKVENALKLTAAGTVLMTCNGNGGYHVTAGADIQSVAGSQIITYHQHVANPTGTTNVNGTFAPVWTHVDRAFASNQLKPGLGYTNIAINASMSLQAPLAINGSLHVNNGANLTLNGQQVTIKNSLDLNSNGTITMQNAADVLDVQGASTGDGIWWDGGGNQTGLITAGTLKVGTDYASFCSFKADVAGSHTVIFNRPIASGLTRVDCQDSTRPFVNAVVAPGTQVRWNDHGYMLGTLDVGAGATVDTWPGSNYIVYVKKALTTASGSTFAPYAVAVSDASGTTGVQGAYNTTITYFQTPYSQVKPALTYHAIHFQASNRLLGPTSLTGWVDVTGSTELDINGHKITVAGTWNHDNPAYTKMDSPADTIIVGGANMWWDGKARDANDLTAGVIIFRGTYMTGASFAASGTHKFVSDGATAGATFRIDGSPTFNRVEVKGLHAVNVNCDATVSDSLIVSAPVGVTGCGQLYVHGPLVTAAASSVANDDLYLYHSTGTSLVSGAFSPAITRFYHAGTPAANAVKPTLAYKGIVFGNGGQHVLAGNTAATGIMQVRDNATTLDFNSHALTVGTNVDVWNNGAVKMLNAGDSLVVGGFVHYNTNAASQILAGVHAVKGNFTVSTPSTTFGGTHKLLLNGTGNQTADVWHGRTSLMDVEVGGSAGRTVNFNNGGLFNGAFTVSSALGVTAASTMFFKGSASSVAGATLATSDAEFHHASGTSLLAAFSSTSDTRFYATGGTLKVGAGLSYANVSIQGSTTVSGGPLAIGGNLLVGTSTNQTPAITIPDGSTFGGSLDNYGRVTFAGGAVFTFDFSWARTGSQTIMAGAAGKFVDFRDINTLAGATIDNSIGGQTANQSAGGLRYKVGRSWNNGALNNGYTGPNPPATHP